MTSRNNDQIKSLQHYIPRFLLEYFAEEGRVNVYDRKTNQFRKQPPKVTAGENAYYVFTDKKGKENAALEKMFTAIEGTAATIIKDLTGDKKTLSAQEKVDLGMFIASLYLRVPESFKKSEDMAVQMTKHVMSISARFDTHFNKGMDQVEKKVGKKISEEERKKIQQSFVEKNYDLRFPKSYILKSMLRNLEEFYNIMIQMEWTIIEAPQDTSFITSDHPALTFNPKPEGFWGSGIGLMAPNCETTAVLTPKLCVFLSQKHAPDVVKFMTAPKKLVDNINIRTTLASSRFVFSQNEILLKELIEKTKLFERGPYSRVKVG